MTAVDRAELKRLAEDCARKADKLGCDEWRAPALLKRAASGLDTLLSEIEGLKAERDALRSALDVCNTARLHWQDTVVPELIRPGPGEEFPVAYITPDGEQRLRAAASGGRYEYVDAGSLPGQGSVALYAHLRTQAPDSWRPDREVVAREIDFYAWGFYDRHIGNQIMLAECKHEVGQSLA